MTATTPSRYPYSVVRWPGKRWAVWDNTADDVAYLNGEPAIDTERAHCLKVSRHLTTLARMYQPDQETAPVISRCATCGTAPGQEHPYLIYNASGDNYPCPDCRGTGRPVTGCASCAGTGRVAIGDGRHFDCPVCSKGESA